jgi:hypothetical protein
MKLLNAVVSVLGMLSLAGPVQAALYAARGAGSAGELYILDPATGSVLTDIGPTNDVAGGNYGITGLAFSSTTGVLYASAANKSAGPGSLLTINPATGLVTLVGSFGLPAGNTMTDLAFDPTSGKLYGISSTGGSNLYTVSLATGAATQVAPSGITFTEGGGIAVNSTGVIYATPIPGDFGTYNATTGAYTNIGGGAPVVTGSQGFQALAFDPNGALYGINLGTGKATHLVKFDPATGTVTDVGPSVTALDSLAFSPAPVPEPGTVGLSVIGSAALALVRRRRN